MTAWQKRATVSCETVTPVCLRILRDGSERGALGAHSGDAVFVGHERPKSRGQLLLKISDSRIEKLLIGELPGAVAHR